MEGSVGPVTKWRRVTRKLGEQITDLLGQGWFKDHLDAS